MIQLVSQQNVFIDKFLIDFIKIKVIPETIDFGISKTLDTAGKIQNSCPMIAVIPENKGKRDYFHQEEKKKEMIPYYKL